MKRYIIIAVIHYYYHYHKGVVEFDDMSDLPITLRTKLKGLYNIGNLRIATEQISKDGTRKRAYELFDGQLIESVLMPYEDGRRTACISSQAGCGMGCKFCATGQMGNIIIAVLISSSLL
jgi:23S rRNA (adenine2503-C2)-methyltransferase